MRRSFSQPPQADDEQEINITPMLDVVFIMLIFFIVTASFVKESGIEVDRPSAVTAVVKEKGNILLAVTETGEVWINRRQVDPRAVRANIERLHAENPQGSGGHPGRQELDDRNADSRDGRLPPGWRCTTFRSPRNSEPC